MTQEIDKVGRGALASFEGATVTSTSLVLDEDITIDRALEIAGVVGKVSRAGGWWVGDLINQSEDMFGQAAAQVADATGWGVDTILAWSKLCRTLVGDDRSDVLSTSTSIDLMRLWGYDKEQYRALREKLEEHYRTTGRNVGHKDVRRMVDQIIGADQGVLEGMPLTTEEELAETQAALTVVRTQLEDLQLRTGEAIRCPRCHAVHPRERFAVGPVE